MDEKNSIKIVFLGDEKTGKTRFVQFLTLGFDFCDFKNYIPTTGASFTSRKFIFNNKLYDLDLWDTAGQEKYSALLRFFFKDADIIFIFFDYNNKNSFERAKFFVNLVKEHCENKNVVNVLVGNKFHLDINSIERDNIIYEEEILEYVDENNLIFAHLSILEIYSNGFNEIFKKSLKEYTKRKSLK